MKGPILVIGFGGKGVGDQIVATPFIRSLALNFPDSAIDFAASSDMGVELLKFDPHLREVFVLDMDCFRLGGRKTFSDKIAYVSWLRKKNYQRAYVLSTKFRHALVAFASGAVSRLGYNSYHRSFLLSNNWQEVQKNMVDRFLDLLVLEGLPVADNRIEIFLQKDEIYAAKQRLNKLFPDGRPIIALAPFSADMRRTWGLRRFIELAGRCCQQGWGVALLGSATDRDYFQGLSCQPGIANLVGILTIREAAAVIASCAAFVGNDSGLAHVSGAVSTPGIVIGYQVTKVWYPSTPSIQTVIKDPGCTSCDLNSCVNNSDRQPPCFESVTVDEIFDRIKLLKRN